MRGRKREPGAYCSRMRSHFHLPNVLWWKITLHFHYYLVSGVTSLTVAHTVRILPTAAAGCHPAYRALLASIWRRICNGGLLVSLRFPRNLGACARTIGTRLSFFPLAPPLQEPGYEARSTTAGKISIFTSKSDVMDVEMQLIKSHPTVHIFTTIKSLIIVECYWAIETICDRYRSVHYCCFKHWLGAGWSRRFFLYVWASVRTKPGQVDRAGAPKVQGEYMHNTIKG